MTPAGLANHHLPVAALSALFLLAAVPVHAQHVEARALAGALAFTPGADTELAAPSVGPALGVGVRLGRARFWGVDVTGVPFQSREGEPFYTSRTRSLSITGELGWRFGEWRRLRAHASGGAGIQRTSSRLLSQTFRATDPLIHAGAGLDVRLTRRLALTSDLRYLRSFGFPRTGDRTDIGSDVLPWPSLHQARVMLGVRVISH